MAGRASIVGAAATHVGKVREHNEDAHFIDVDRGLFLVCDGMGGHAAGEVASELAIRAIRRAWASDVLLHAADRWLERGTPDAKKQLLEVVRGGVVSAHDAILEEADRDDTKSGMGTTLVGAIVVGGELVFAHAGDSRAYLVRDGISMQLTEDHTLLARLLAAGIDVDVSGEGSRFRSMLTNALGIGDECKVSTFLVPLADGDRFLLCSDGISEYVPENEVGEILSKQSSPARAAQRLIDLALERGGGDNATAIVVRVLEAGETPLPAEQRKKDDLAIGACPLWGKRVTPQQRLRALRIAIPRDHNFGEKLPPHALGDRVAWIIIEGELVQDGVQLGPGALVYPESLIHAGEAAPLPDRDALAITRSDVRALAIRADDFRELCDDDGELGETLLESLATVIGKRKPREPAPVAAPVDPRGNTDPQLRTLARGDVPEDDRTTDPRAGAIHADERDRAAMTPDDAKDAGSHGRAQGWARPAESPVIAPPPRPPASQPPSRPSPPPRMSKTTAPGLPPTRPSPIPDGLAAKPTPPGAPPASAATASPPAASGSPPAASASPPAVSGSPPVRPSPPPERVAAKSTPPGAPPASVTASPPVASASPPVRPSPPPERVAAKSTLPGAPPAPPPPASPPTRPSPPPEGVAPKSTPPPVPSGTSGASASSPPSPWSRPGPPPERVATKSTPPPPPLATSAPSVSPTSTSPPPERAGTRSTPPPAPGARPSQPIAPPSATTQPPSRPSQPSAAPSPATQPPSRPSQPSAAPSPATQPPSRPSQPSAPPSRAVEQATQPPSRPSQPTAQASPAAAPSRPSQPTAQASPTTAAASQPIAQASLTTGAASRLSQPLPSTAPTSSPTPTSAPSAALPPTRPTPPPATLRAADTAPPENHATKAPPRGFGPALTPPSDGAAVDRPSTPPAAVPHGAGTSRPHRPRRPPTDPEIETYLELEADLPPESGVDPDLESELALSIALSGDFEAGHESVSITIEEGRTRVIETVTETDAHTLTLTVTEPVSGHESMRPRAITADDGAAVSGTISIPEDRSPQRRVRANSEGRDD